MKILICSIHANSNMTGKLFFAFREKSPRTSADIVLSFSIKLPYRARCPQEETGQRTFGLARIPRHGRGHECPPKSGGGLRRTCGGHPADTRRTSGFTKNHTLACRSSRCGLPLQQVRHAAPSTRPSAALPEAPQSTASCSSCSKSFDQSCNEQGPQNC